MTCSRSLGAVVFLTAIATSLLLSPISTAQIENPYNNDRAAIRAGAALFDLRCASCHGADAKGLSGPDLTVLWVEDIDDEQVFRTINNGVPGSIMPSSSAPEHEIWAVVAHLKSISTVSTFEYDSGDAQIGRSVFLAQCSECHRVNGHGGVLGPDLTRITRIRSRDNIERSIRDPSANVVANYRSVSLLTKEGEKVRGAIKNEDAFSIQIVDTGERLQGYLKADLRDIVHESQSLMPEFNKSELGESDMNDLLRFLGAINEPRSD